MSTILRRTARVFTARPRLALGFAVAAAVVAVGARVMLHPVFRDAAPFVFVMPAVLVVAAAAGARAGAIALALGGVLTWALVMAPPGGLLAFGAGNAISYAAFAASGAVILWVAAELRQTAAEASAVRARLEAALAASATGTWRWDAAAGRLDWDAPLAAVFGLLPEAAPTRADDFLALVLPEDRAAVRQAVEAVVARGGALEHEFRIRHADGSERWIYDRATVSLEADGRPAAIVGACQDVTARKRAEAALLDLAADLENRVRREVAAREAAQAALARAQRMEALGQLTGGIAHDFNNLLQALSGCLQMIRRRVPDQAVRGFVDAGQQAVERGGRLTRQLTAFARRQALHPEPTDVRNHVLGMSELLARALRADIDLAIDLAPDLWPIDVDPTQFEVALLNLAVNARDAMPDGGDLAIACRNRPGEAGEGDRVEVAVRDTGTGIAPDIIERVFEPFFTTKDVGKGSGLGLSQVYGFAAQSGGTVRIDSEPGAGTAVTMILPRSFGEPRQRAVPAEIRLNRPGGRILVVEDDPIVGAMVGAMLGDFGYAVVRATSADQALDLVADDARIDLVLSDVVMPGRMSGVDLARALTARRPPLPVVLTTGYSENAAVPDGVRTLAKPYTVAVLLDAIEEALGDRPSAPDEPDLFAGREEGVEAGPLAPDGRDAGV